MLRRHWKSQAIALAAAIGLFVAGVRYQWATTLATIGLLWVTFQYLLVTQDTLNLSRGEAKRRQTVFPHFDLGIRDQALYLRVSNLGLSDFLLQTVHVRRADKTEVDYEMHRIVESGKTEHILLPNTLYEDSDVDVEFTLNYLGLDGTGKTAAKCFHVSLDPSDDTPYKITEGLDSFWYVNCPKCGMRAVTNTFGLKTFEAAEAKTKQLAQDLADSCPEHRSDHLLTPENFPAQQAERRDRQAIP